MNARLIPVLVLVLLAGRVESVSAAVEPEKKILYWVAPMDPSYRRDSPGKSPMGMDLIPVYEDAEAGEADVRISPAVMQNLGVRTAKVQKGSMSRRIDTVGYIDFDESRVSHIHMRVSGWIERLSVKSEGEKVSKGQRLFNIYSPDLVNAQEEFLRALNSGNQGLIRASRERLRALGIGSGEIARLEKTRKVQQTVPLYAPQAGVVSELKVREGMYVKPASNIMTLADLSSVWLIAEIFERQADWVRTGDQAEMRLPFLPGKTWRGQVEYIYPSLDARTRTLLARLRFDNPDESLKPNMYARVRLQASPRNNVLSIPLEALIRTGNRDRVIVALGEGRFNAVEVLAGMESGERVEILEGLQPGDEVVISGQFLLDSEASLKASFTRMSDEKTAPQARKGTEPPVTGEGIIRALMADHRMVTLAHEAIPALGWPAMEMGFTYGEMVDVGTLKPGDRVRFELEKDQGDYRIIAIEPVAPEARP